MPTSASNTYSANRVTPAYGGDQARCVPVNLIASTTFARGTVLGELTATPGTYKAYASGNADGSQTPKLILQYDCVTDASGNVYIGTSATSQFGDVRKDAPAYIPAGGIGFNTTDLTGLDAGALGTLQGRLISGTLANGVVEF